MVSRDKLTIWHPFTQMLGAAAALEVRRASGAYLELADGRQLLDCISSWWVTLHGHANEEIAEAIFDQAKKLEQVIFAGFTHEPAENLAAVLAERLPAELSHVFFSDNGSTAVEVALKMSFQYWRNQGEKRTRFLAFEGGYHGDTVGAMSIGSGSPFWNKFEPLMFCIDLAPFPDTFDSDCNVEIKEEAAIKRISEILESGNGEHAAICIEPLIQGAAGMRICRPQFLERLRQIADRYNVLLIFDEVMTGFGRTGDWFACTKSLVTPDIICLSKGISGGFLPLSVTVCRAKIYEAFLGDASEKTFFHGHSYTANPLACAAAVSSWALLEKNQHLFQKMESLHRKLAKQELSGLDKLCRLRFCGSIFAADIDCGDSGGYFFSLVPEMKKRFIELGYLIRPLGNTIYLMPPYCVTDEQLEEAYRTIAKVIKELL